MKHSKLTWFLFAFALMLTLPTAVKTSPKTKATTDFTLYYWFDASDGSFIRQNYIDIEELWTDLDESQQNPKLLVEKGFAPASVYIGADGTPVPNTAYPDKSLFWHYVY